MKRKFNILLVLSFFIISLFSYKANISQANIYDVAPATSPVSFRITLSESTQHINLPVSHNLNYKGSGSYIVIIDTGIEKSHPFFQDRVALEACFSVRCPNGSREMIGSGAAVPVHWHGTHVAGIAAGYNSAFTGVAPEAKIIAINVFDSSGAAYDSDIIKALSWVSTISSQYNIVSVNMSLGGSMTFTGTCDNYIPEMTSAIKNLKDKNIATVVSSGNNYAFGMSAPACISHSVSVAATERTQDKVTTFSNISTHTDLAAPGSGIISSKLMGSYSSASGTSMSAPFITGAFAVYRSAYGVHSVDKVVSDFQNSGKNALDTYTNITVKRFDFTNLFTSSPSPTTTTTSTLPPTTSTTVVVSPTTTTLPVVTTTTISPPTTSPPSPPEKLPYIPKPLLLELNGFSKKFVWVKYRDPYMNKSFISYYNLVCNDSFSYHLPISSLYSLHSFKLEVSPSLIDYCYLSPVTIYGTTSPSSSVRKIYPSNKKKSSLKNSSPKSFSYDRIKSTTYSNKINIYKKKKKKNNKSFIIKRNNYDLRTYNK
jgi:subtilisin family serine protease